MTNKHPQFLLHSSQYSPLLKKPSRNTIEYNVHGHLLGIWVHLTFVLLKLGACHVWRSILVCQH